MFPRVRVQIRKLNFSKTALITVITIIPPEILFILNFSKRLVSINEMVPLILLDLYNVFITAISVFGI